MNSTSKEKQNSAVEIRRAAATDVDAIASIHAQSWLESYEGILDPSYLNYRLKSERLQAWRNRFSLVGVHECTFVATVESIVVGFIHVIADEDSTFGSYIDNLHILGSHQSQGLGRALFERAIRWLTDQASSPKLFLLVAQHNNRAQKVYRHLGARHAGQLSWTAPEGTHVLTYRFVWDDFQKFFPSV